MVMLNPTLSNIMDVQKVRPPLVIIRCARARSKFRKCEKKENKGELFDQTGTGFSTGERCRDNKKRRTKWTSTI